MLLLINLGTRGVSSKGKLLFLFLATSFGPPLPSRRIIGGQVTSACHAPLTLSGYAPAIFLMALRSKTASGRTFQTSAPRVDQFSAKGFARP
jgi:hypothetical protein